MNTTTAVDNMFVTVDEKTYWWQPYCEITKLVLRETSKGVPYLTFKVEMYNKPTNGKVQYNSLGSCWNPEAFESIDNAFKSETRVDILQRRSNSSKGEGSEVKYYDNITVHSLRPSV